MRRLLVIHPFQCRLRRGIETFVRGLLPRLAARNFEVDLLTWDGPLPDDPAAQGVTTRRLPPRRYFEPQRAVPAYVRALCGGRYEEVMVFFAGYGEGRAVGIAESLRLRQSRLTVVLHFPASLVPHRYHEFVRWRMFERAGSIIGVSKVTAREAEPWARRNVQVIPNGLDVEAYNSPAGDKTHLREELGLPAGARLLVCASAMEERKGIQYAIAAMEAVRRQTPGAQLWILGEGPYLGALQQQIRRLQLGDCVRLCGVVPDVRPYLAAADVGLLLSRGEAMPMAALEMAASGLAMVTSRWDPFPDMFTAQSALMVDETDPAVVAQAIVRCLEDRSLRQSLGEQARHVVAGQYSLDSSAEAYAAILSS